MTIMEDAPAVLPSSLVPVGEMPPDGWWMCMCWAGKEAQIASELLRARAHFFLPYTTIYRRKQEIRRPMFSRYVFLNGDEAVDVARMHTMRSEDRCTIYPLPKKSRVLLHEELVSISLAIEANPYLTVDVGVKKGQKVRICKGPMQGTIGIVESIDQRSMTVHLNCSLMNRSLPVEDVPAEQVEPYFD